MCGEGSGRSSGRGEGGGGGDARTASVPDMWKETSGWPETSWIILMFSSVVLSSEPRYRPLSLAAAQPSVMKPLYAS